MKFKTSSCSLLLALLMLASHSAWSQCLMYNDTYKGLSLVQSSSSNLQKGSTLIGPQQQMQDGLTRCSYVTFDTNTYKYKSNGETKTIKEFYYYNHPITDGNPSSGGFLIGLVKQGKMYKVLATVKDVFDSDTVSGTASWKNLLGYGFTYYASTLSGVSSGWVPDDTELRPIGDTSSTGADPVKANKYTESISYVLNTNETAIVANMTYDKALEWKKQSLNKQGYIDRIANPNSYNK